MGSLRRDLQPATGWQEILANVCMSATFQVARSPEHFVSLKGKL
jgi:hypothetical protein